MFSKSPVIECTSTAPLREINYEAIPGCLDRPVHLALPDHQAEKARQVTSDPRDCQEKLATADSLDVTV